VVAEAVPVPVARAPAASRPATPYLMIVGAMMKTSSIGWGNLRQVDVGRASIISSPLAGPPSWLMRCDWGMTTSMTARFAFSRARVVTVNAHLRSRSAGLRAYLPAANA
jgi:hypothetical protein